MLKPGTPHAPLPPGAGDATVAWLDEKRNAKGSLATHEIRREMQRSMQRDAAVFRTAETLKVSARVCCACGARVRVRACAR